MTAQETCGYCGRGLSESGDSLYFCNADCQMCWQRGHRGSEVAGGTQSSER